MMTTRAGQACEVAAQLQRDSCDGIIVVARRESKVHYGCLLFNASITGEIRWDARLIPEALKRLDGSMYRRFVDGRKFPRMLINLSSLQHIHFRCP